MQTTEEFYLFKLKEELSLRQKTNPHYSLRAMAKDLEIDSSNLSAILRGKRRLPVRRAETVATKLKLSPIEHHLFIGSVTQKNSTLDQIKPDQPSKFYLLDEIYYRVIAEWEYYALLKLIKTKDFNSDTSWIAQRLGLTCSRVEVLIENLLQLKMIKKVTKGKLIRTVPNLETSENIESEALQKSHHENLQLAAKKLEEVDVLKRDFSSLTLAINTQKIGQAKAIIREFQDKLQALIEDESADEVYSFNCQLFPLTNKQPGDIHEN